MTGSTATATLSTVAKSILFRNRYTTFERYPLIWLTQTGNALSSYMLFSLSRILARQESKQQTSPLSAVGLLFGDFLCLFAVGHHSGLCLQ